MTAPPPRRGPGRGRTSGAVRETRAAVAGALRRADLEGARLVVAVSGGQDSLALLDALCSLRGPLRLELVCAHFDHGLRGAESAADARFVRQHCERAGLECVAGAAEEGRQIRGEESAREARYGFLSLAVERAGAAAVAVGHSATDQAETVLLNIVRGAGLAGLSAMREDSVLPVGGRELRVVRPLLSVQRPALARYCQDAGLAPRLDSSNESGEFARNRVRRSLVPLLRTFNPAVEDALVRLAENASRAAELVESEAERLWPQCAREDGGSVSIARSASSLPPAVAGAIARRAVARVKGDLRDVRQGHVDAVADLLRGARGRTVRLPGGLEAVARGDAVVVRPGPPRAAGPEGPLPLPVPGTATWSGWLISTSVEDAGDGDRPPADGALTARLDPALADGPLWVRGWIDGDRIQPSGMTGTRKLQDLFVDDRVPREERRSVPLVVSERGIAWVAGRRVAGWATAPRGAGRWLRVRAARPPT